MSRKRSRDTMNDNNNNSSKEDFLNELDHFHHNLLYENFETLKLLIICYDYIQLVFEGNNKENYSSNELERLKRQKPRLLRMIALCLNSIEGDLLIQEWFHEDYGDTYFLKSHKNNEFEKRKLSNWNKNFKYRKLDVIKAYQYGKKLLCRLECNYGIEIQIKGETFELLTDALLSEDFTTFNIERKL